MVVVKHPRRLTPEEMRQVGRLHIRGGTMIYGLRTMRQAHSRRDAVLLAKEGQTIVAWALVSGGYPNEQGVLLYVRRSHRRRGIGTRLLKRAHGMSKRAGCRLRAIPWNDSGLSFFESARSSGLDVRW